jgi:NADH dehydrogenase (ubiquinone) 1 alpha subcomplex subunit 5
MRSTFRLLASVKPARYLEPGAMTGITGLYTHGSPRSTLLYLYGTTLEKLKAFPESSLYRQSVEALTRHRLALVEQTVPPGHAEWAVRAQKVIAEHPEQFQLASGRVDGSGARTVTLGGTTFLVGKSHGEHDIRTEEWDGETDEGAELEGPRSAEERADQVLIAERVALNEVTKVTWEAEPQLTADQ